VAAGIDFPVLFIEIKLLALLPVPAVIMGLSHVPHPKSWAQQTALLPS